MEFSFFIFELAGYRGPPWIFLTLWNFCYELKHVNNTIPCAYLLQTKNCRTLKIFWNRPWSLFGKAELWFIRYRRKRLKVNASNFDSVVSHTRRSGALEIREVNSVVAQRSLLNIFACGQVSSPRLYRLCYCSSRGRKMINISGTKDHRIFYFWYVFFSWAKVLNFFLIYIFALDHIKLVMIQILLARSWSPWFR